MKVYTSFSQFQMLAQQAVSAGKQVGQWQRSLSKKALQPKTRAELSGFISAYIHNQREYLRMISVADKHSNFNEKRIMKSTLQLSLLLLTLVSLNVAAQTQTCSDDSIVETAPASRFTINGDGTVSDRQTGLMWAQCAQGLMGAECTGTATVHTWSQALRLTEATSDTRDRTDWRLPNIKELQSLVERSCFNPAINATVFPNTIASTSRFFWSASPDAFNTLGAWGVHFDDGTVGNNGRNFGRRVRLVRGGSAQ